MVLSYPSGQQQIASPVVSKNFLAYQSLKLAVTTTTAQALFTAPVTNQVTTIMIYNSGTQDCYLSSGPTVATAVVSTASPLPADGVMTSTCHCIPAKAIVLLDFLPNVRAFAAITATGATTLELSLGYGA